MGITYNGVEVSSVVFNGTAIDSMVFNGQTTFTSQTVELSQVVPSGGDSSSLSGAADGNLFLTNTLAAGQEATILENQYASEILATSYSISGISYTGGNAVVELQSIIDDPAASWETVDVFNVISGPQDFSGTINTAAKSFRIQVISSDNDGQLAIDSFYIGVTEYDSSDPDTASQTEAPSGGELTSSETQDNVFFNTVVSSGSAFDILKKSYPEKVSLTGYNITGLYFSGSNQGDLSTASLQASDDDVNWSIVANFSLTDGTRKDFSDTNLNIEARYFRLRMSSFVQNGYASLDSLQLNVQPLSSDVIDDVSSLVTEPAISEGLGQALAINDTETRIAICGGQLGNEKIVIHELNDGVIGNQIGGYISYSPFDSPGGTYGFGKYDLIRISDDGQTVVIVLTNLKLYVYKLSGSQEWQLFATHANPANDISSLYMSPDASVISWGDPYYGGSSQGRVSWVRSDDSYTNVYYVQRTLTDDHPFENFAFDYYGYGSLNGFIHEGKQYLFIPAHGNGHSGDTARVDGERRGLVDLYVSNDGNATFTLIKQFVGLDSPDTSNEQIGYGIAANFATNGNLVVRVLGSRFSDASLNEHIYETDLSDTSSLQNHVNTFNRSSLVSSFLNSKQRGNLVVDYFDSTYRRLKFNPDATSIEDYYVVEQTILNLEGSGEGTSYEAYAILSDGTMFYGFDWAARTAGGVKKYIPQSALPIPSGPQSAEIILTNPVSENLAANQSKFSFNTIGVADAPELTESTTNAPYKQITFSSEQGSEIGANDGSGGYFRVYPYSGTADVTGGVFEFNGLGPTSGMGGLVATLSGFSTNSTTQYYGRAYSLWVKFADSDIGGVTIDPDKASMVFADAIWPNGENNAANGGSYLMQSTINNIKSNIDPEQVIATYYSPIQMLASNGSTDTDGNFYYSYAVTTPIKRKHFPDGNFEFNKWYHLVFTNDNTNQTQNVYINGEFRIGSTHTRTDKYFRYTDYRPFELGRRAYYNYTGMEFQGWVGQFDYYLNGGEASPLSESDPAAIYNAEVPYYNYLEQNSGGQNSSEAVSGNTYTEPLTLGSGTKDLEMIYVEPGTFTMGDVGGNNAEPVHNVTLTKGFYLGKYEVTQAQYEAVMTGIELGPDWSSATPSQYGGNPDRPVEAVSWNNVQVFLTRLNEQQAGNIPDGWEYALPTEAEWEYACRAGTTTAYSWGDAISSTDANYYFTVGETTDVGQYSANPWGFFDMHGNVYEWTADAWGSYAAGDQTDPFNVGVEGDERVIRGGGWQTLPEFVRSGNRYSDVANKLASHIGFRVALKQIS